MFAQTGANAACAAAQSACAARQQRLQSFQVSAAQAEAIVQTIPKLQLDLGLSGSKEKLHCQPPQQVQHRQQDAQPTLSTSASAPGGLRIRRPQSATRHASKRKPAP